MSKLKRETKSDGLFPLEDSFEKSVVNSALWAAAGDALGWITELSYGPEGVERRVGQCRVARPAKWRRRIGGRTGPTAVLPAGTYSDDTQLRLAVCRSIRGDGYFDVEALAKVELPVWPVYALGAGTGTKAAVSNLVRRQVNWFSNFFDRKAKRYIECGGNGAAMRIQPHVWSNPHDQDSFVLDVLKDSLVTHGHPHGFCGSVLHALCLAQVLRTESRLDLEGLHNVARFFGDINRLVDSDSQLSTFWKGHWEDLFGQPLEQALTEISNETYKDIDLIEKEFSNGVNDPVPTYRRILELLGCLESRFRGSGTKTALAAASLSILYSGTEIEKCLVTAANELESDTDTIATMAGALLGTVSDHEPSWKIQDRAYIESEAKRLAAISRNEPQSSFSYPDLSTWVPPIRQNAGVGMVNGSMALVGLGEVTELGHEYSTKDAIWKWLELPFGQSVLAKTKRGGTVVISHSQLPGKIQLIEALDDEPSIKSTSDNIRWQQQDIQDSTDDSRNASARQTENDHSNDQVSSMARVNIDSLTDEVIMSDFSETIVGRNLLNCVNKFQSVEAAVSYASIVAKAILARKRRKRTITD